MATRKHSTPPQQLELGLFPTQLILPLSIEEWLPIAGWEGYYEVSNWGRVRSVDRYVPILRRHCKTYKYAMGQIRKLSLTQWQYLAVTLQASKKRRISYLVHVLVLEAFVGPRPIGYDCNHRDGNKSNNHVDNLAWVTHNENMKHAWRTGLHDYSRENPYRKFTDEQIRIVRKQSQQGKTFTAIARECSIDRHRVSMIVNRIIYKDVF